MWCVWELAVYLRTRPDPKIVFTSVTMRMIEIIVIVVSVLCNLMIDVTEDVTGSDVVDARSNEAARQAFLATCWLAWAINLYVTILLLKKNLANKIFGYLARCEAKFLYFNPKKRTIFIKMMSKCKQNAVKF